MGADKYIPPAESIGDHIHTLARAGISAIPILGSPAVELFQAVFAPPLKRRQQEWMTTLAEGIRRLEHEKRLDVDELGKNAAFIDTVLQASQAAIRTSQQEKIDALRNAALNSALPSRPNDTLREIFLQWVERFTPLHLRLLAFLQQPPKYKHRDYGGATSITTSGSLWDMVSDAFPELANQKVLVDIVARDLQENGLLTIAATSKFGGASSIVPTGLTDLGKQFIAFVSAPQP